MRSGVLMVAAVAMAFTPSVAGAEPATVLFNDQVIEVERTLADPNY